MRLTTPLLAVEGGGDGGSFWEEAYPVIPHPAELIVGFIALAILFAIVARKVVPRFEAAFAARTEAIEGGMAKAERAQQEAQAALAQYRAQLADARGEAGRIRADAQSERAAIIEQARREATVAAQAVADRTHAQLQADLNQARTHLSRDVGRIAVELASRIVAANLADTDRTRATIDSFIADLETSGVPDSAATARTAGGAGTPPDGADGRRVAAGRSGGSAGTPNGAGGATALDVVDPVAGESR